MWTYLRAQSRSIAWGAGTFAVLLVCFLVGQAVYQHLQQDHLDHHLIVEVLKYNIARGHLEQLPVPKTGAPPLPPAKD